MHWMLWKALMNTNNNNDNRIAATVIYIEGPGSVPVALLWQLYHFQVFLFYTGHWDTKRQN